MQEITITLKQLRNMIGIHVYHQGVACHIVEVLEDGPSIVLKCLDEDHIQANQYGDPSRRVAQTFIIPVLSIDGGTIHPAYLALDLIE